jgi:DNA-binding NarL/FixJ family response regulator
MDQGMAGSRHGSPELAALERRPPSEFTVELLQVGEDEFGVFSWSADAPGAAESLTTAEQQVLRLVARGASNAEIAAMRGTSARTVANQVAGLLRKLGAGSRFHLIGRFGDGEAGPKT